MDKLVKIVQRKKVSGLGFRGLHLFNLALLAKQGWKVVIFHETLLYRDIKSKYFPISSQLTAKLE